MFREQVRSRCRCRVFRANIASVSTLRLMISGLFFSQDESDPRSEDAVHSSVFTSWRDTRYLQQVQLQQETTPSLATSTEETKSQQTRRMETTSASNRSSSHCEMHSAQVTFGTESREVPSLRFKAYATAMNYDERRDEFMHKSHQRLFA